MACSKLMRSCAAAVPAVVLALLTVSVSPASAGSSSTALDTTDWSAMFRESIANGTTPLPDPGSVVNTVLPPGPSGCTHVAAPGGLDTGPGSETMPYATAQRLALSLGPGEVGCLRQGTYQENVTIARGGSGDSARATLKSWPGERAKISGRLWVTDSANFVTVEQLDLDGHDAPQCSASDWCRLPSPTVNGDNLIFQDNDVTNRHQGICFNLGNASYGRAANVTIQRNRIHDCGLLPANNHEHGIYLSYSDNTRILNNDIYDNADRGIQLYPDAQRTLVRGNVIDGNGEGVIFSGVGSTASNDNVVENNIVTYSKIRHNIESYYPDIVGTGNVARNNCVFGAAQGDIGSAYGFTATSNLTADPGYVNRAGKDFRLSAGSPCASLLAGSSLAPAGGRPRTGSGTPPRKGGGTGRRTHSQTLTRNPRIRVRGLGHRCAKRRVRLRVRVSATSPLRRVRVYVDGRRVKSTKRARFSKRLGVWRLRSGKHRLRVVASDRAGRKSVRKRAFVRC
jgi:parallel beta-helix repeat protein